MEYRYSPESAEFSIEPTSTRPQIDEVKMREIFPAYNTVSNKCIAKGEIKWEISELIKGADRGSLKQWAIMFYPTSRDEDRVPMYDLDRYGCRPTSEDKASPPPLDLSTIYTPDAYKTKVILVKPGQGGVPYAIFDYLDAIVTKNSDAGAITCEEEDKPGSYKITLYIQKEA